MTALQYTPFLKHVVKNKRAHFEYTLLSKYVAGMVLTGTEVKSIRLGKVSLQEAYCYFAKGELWVKGMHIAAYVQGNLQNHVPDRDRKLLLHSKELKKLLRSKEKGLTIVPIQLFFNERGLPTDAVLQLQRGLGSHDALGLTLRAPRVSSTKKQVPICSNCN